MLASLQNFRPGQLNYQSCSHQATLNASVGVFTNAPFAGIDISGFEVAAGAGLLGTGLGALTAGAELAPLVGAGGAILGLVEYENQLAGTNPFGDDEDGPGWWTGSWALPMIVQSGSAAIVAYDYSSIQEFLAEDGSHTWFPKSGFDRVVERRTSAYDDANFFLLDITDIGPKGFWLFGRIVHPVTSGDPGEAYIGVFSNQRPKWLDQSSDTYAGRLEDQTDTKVEDKQKAIDDKLEELEDKDGVGDAGRDAIKSAVERAVSAHAEPFLEQDAWTILAQSDLAGSADPMVAPGMQAMVPTRSMSA